MTNQQIKTIIDTATTSEELKPLYDYHQQIKKKEAKISQILLVKEKQISSFIEIETIKNITL